MRADYSVINAVDRLSKVEFSADQDWETYPASTYTCPHCSEQMSFGMRDFEKHRLSQFTNLSLNDAQAIAAASPAPEDKFNSFVDFYCSGCQTPVRILYLAWAGGRFTHGYTLSYVIERPA
ncbi:MAG TPA: hypothetical protein VFP64_21690 [Pyrinomonadaceae bacterium]|nr:hypothetical protein [Pyrinomonadaceae bacterium]